MASPDQHRLTNEHTAFTACHHWSRPDLALKSGLSAAIPAQCPWCEIERLNRYVQIVESYLDRETLKEVLTKYRNTPDGKALEPGVQHRIYTHVKTGNQYEVLHDAMETTNGSREGRGAVVYRRIGQSAVYVREASEFHEKFVSSGEPASREAVERRAAELRETGVKFIVNSWRCQHGTVHAWPIAVAACGCERPSSDADAVKS